MGNMKQSGFAAVHLVVLLVGLAGVVGWVTNIVKLFGSSFDPITGEVVLRAVGIFIAPLGAVMGFL